MPRTGAPFGQHWRPHSAISKEAVHSKKRLGVCKLIGNDAVKCARKPRTIQGEKIKKFTKFIRRVVRNYRAIFVDDQTLLIILVDDHLDGMAKSVFCSLPSAIVEQGFEAVEELRRLL